MLKQTRLNWLGFNPDFGEPETVTPSEYQSPTRLRGELFDQPRRVTYVFGEDRNPMPISLCTFHDQRLIVIQMDVATVKSVNADWPSLVEWKADFADQILSKLRARYIGLKSKWMRLIGRKQTDYYVQGPFIPFEQGIAVASLVIRVGLDSNFDEAYKIAQRFLELHPQNENFKYFDKVWNKRNPKPESSRPLGAYRWTDDELKAIESMAPLEPASDAFGAGHTNEERLRFNEIVWRQCQKKLSRVEQGSDVDVEAEASVAASRTIRNFFNMN